MGERRIPTREEALTYRHERRHWGQWGEDNQMGTLTLLTPAKRVHKVVAGSGSPANPMTLF